MTNQEYLTYILGGDFHEQQIPLDDDATKELAGLVSGSFIYRLYEKLVIHEYSIPAITSHLEMLNDTGNYFGLLYFMFMLSETVDEPLPPQYADLTTNHHTAPFLASALFEDWVDYDEDYVI